MTEPAAVPGPATDGPHCAVFVSYTRDDQKRALPIVNALKAAGFTVWWDSMIGGGERFLPATEAALENARAVIVLWSARSVNSHWVRDEATRGRDRNCMVPLSLDGTEPPLGFRQFQTIDFSSWRGRSTAPECARLIDAVARLCEKAPASPASTATAPLISRRAIMVGGATTLVAASAFGLWQSGLIGQVGPTTNSVAVLPFENLGGDDRNYFAEGLSAELRAELSRNAALKVAAQASSAAARKSDTDARRMASRLGVAFLLDGNVRISETMVRIAAELIDGSTGLVTWTKSFERPMGDVLEVQSEIAAAVTAALTSVIVSDTAASAVTVGGTANVAAYDAYLRGRDLYANAVDEAGERAALDRFDAAITLDPGFAAAHAARARSLTVIANQYGSQEEAKAYSDMAVRSAERAVAIAPDFADAQSTLGAVLFQGRLEVARARIPYDRSYALGGGDASVIGRFALYCANTGRTAEALAGATRAVELDPLNPLTQLALGFVHYAARRYRQAIVPIEAALAQNPELGSSNASLASARYMLGDMAGARDAFARESNPLYRETGLAIVERRLGGTAAAQQARARVIDGLGIGQLTLYQQAQIAAQWDEADEAMRLLLLAHRAVDSGLIFLRIDPLLDPLRQRPDFIRLLSALGFR